MRGLIRWTPTGSEQRSQNGIAVRRSLEDLLAFVTARAMYLTVHATPEECLLRDAFLGARPQWCFQYPIVLKGARAKAFPLIFDFYCPSLKLAIELDGRQHEKHKGHDARRDRACRFNGIEVMRFTNKCIHKDLEAVLEEINDVVRGRTHD
jgi:hypothetical protein